jgi:DNA-binding SARP family transcriptional activator
MRLEIRLLGPPQVEVDGRPLVVDTRKAIALLAYVAVVARPLARDVLADLLWPDSDPEDARGALRRTLSVLRSGLGGGWLTVDRRQVSLSADGVDVDVVAFRSAVLAASHAHAPGERCESCRASLRSAVARYRGDFLEGFSLRDSAPWDDWQALEAEALRGELAGALRRLAGLEAADGRFAEAVLAARRLLTLDPLDEAAHRSLMRLHALGGDRAAAIRQYEACARILDTELGVEPEAETVSLHRDVVEGRLGPVAVTPGPVPPGVAATSDPVLDAAAVLGEPVDPDLVVAMLDQPEEKTLDALQRLARDGVLREPVDGEEADGYRFADEAKRQRAVAAVGLARRRALERRAAAAHTAAAERATGASRHARAAAHLRAALALGHRDRASLLARLGDAETAAGRYGEALAAYEQGAAAAPPAELAAFEHRLGALHLRRGALELADLHLSAALGRLTDGGPAPLRSVVLADRSLVALRRDEAGAAQRLARDALAAARSAADTDGEARAENVLALLARRAGDTDGARRHLRRSLERAGLSDRPDARVAALNNLALLERVAGNLDDALALTEEALRRCVAHGDRHREAALRNNRADLLHALGRPREAQEELVRSVTAFAEVGDRHAFEPEIWKLVDW